MDEGQLSEAEALWNDVIDLMARQPGAQAPLVAMLKKCVPTNFDGAALEVSAPARFMKMQIENNSALIEKNLAEVAFMPIALQVSINVQPPQAPVSTSSVMSAEEVNAITATQREVTRPINTGALRTPNAYGMSGAGAGSPAYTAGFSAPAVATLSFQERYAQNPLVSEVTESDSKLTFERFVQGDENEIALQAAKQVADGNMNYNPLFIYGKSGLGKTHLLKAIQNYILENQIEKICVYRVAHDFVADYVQAMRSSTEGAKDAFTRSYQDVDVLIIDDIQFLKGSGTVGFFFDLFNYLKANGKQIVLAADESPRELGLSNQDFNDRMISRLDMGVACPIQVPNYELKYALIANFYQNMKKDAAADHIPGFEGELTPENLSIMADRAGTNIRVIESFCQQCLMEATKKQAKGRTFGDEDIISLATQKFGIAAHNISIESIMNVVEEEYDIDHDALIGNSRKKELMIPRKLCLYLARDLTDMTLADIGKCFSNRSHATVIKSVEDIKKSTEDDYLFSERVAKIRQRILDA